MTDQQRIEKLEAQVQALQDVVEVAWNHNMPGGDFEAYYQVRLDIARQEVHSP